MYPPQEQRWIRRVLLLRPHQLTQPPASITPQTRQSRTPHGQRSTLIPSASPPIRCTIIERTPQGLRSRRRGIITAPTSANPTARIYHSADQAIPDATWTTLNFNSERIDTDTMHDNSTNNSRITIKTAGNYPASVDIAFASNNTGIRAVRLLANGATQIALKQVGATQGFATVIDLSMPPYPFSVNDYIQAQVYQNSGGSLNVLNVGNYSPEFGMWKV